GRAAATTTTAVTAVGERRGTTATATAEVAAATTAATTGGRTSGIATGATDPCGTRVPGLPVGDTDASLTARAARGQRAAFATTATATAEVAAATTAATTGGRTSGIATGATDPCGTRVPGLPVGDTDASLTARAARGQRAAFATTAGRIADVDLAPVITCRDPA